LDGQSTAPAAAASVVQYFLSQWTIAAKN